MATCFYPRAAAAWLAGALILVRIASMARHAAPTSCNTIRHKTHPANIPTVIPNRLQPPGHPDPLQKRPNSIPQHFTHLFIRQPIQAHGRRAVLAQKDGRGFTVPVRRRHGRKVKHGRRGHADGHTVWDEGDGGGVRGVVVLQVLGAGFVQG